MERVLSKVDQNYALYVQMPCSFVGFIHLTMRGPIYVSVGSNPGEVAFYSSVDTFWGFESW